MIARVLRFSRVEGRRRSATRAIALAPVQPLSSLPLTLPPSSFSPITIIPTTHTLRHTPDIRFFFSICMSFVDICAPIHRCCYL